MNRQNQRYLRGFTLTEIAIVLGIIGLILGAIWTAANSVYQNQKIGRASAQLAVIVANMKSFQGGLTTGGGFATAMCNAGVFPSDMVSGGCGSPLTDPWGHAVTVTATDANTYQISYSNMPAPGCIGMLVRNGSNSMTAMGLTAVAAGAFGTSQGGSMTMMGGALVVPVTVDAAIASCPTTSNFGGATANGYPITYSGNVTNFTFSTQ